MGWPYLAALVVMRLAYLTRVRKVVLGLALPSSIGGDESSIVDGGVRRLYLGWPYLAALVVMRLA